MVFGFNATLKKQLAEQAAVIRAQEAKLSAISRSMAIIEFDLQGNILTANDNFLKTMGYTLAEIQGKHHRLFVEPAFAQSAEYTQCWRMLGEGQFFVNRFKRLAKGNRVVWIEASYNPIFDEMGRPLKIVKFATDITDRVLAEENSRGQLKAIDRAMAVIEFDLQGNILTANQNFLDTMGYSLAEIKGQHHRIFTMPDYAQSAEYQQFWQRLAKGELMTGTFKRCGKNKKVVWIEASYNPIFHADGTPYKIVKYATDIGSNANTRLLQSVIEDTSHLLESVAQGDLLARFQGQYDAYRDTMFYPLIKRLQASTSHMIDSLKNAIGQASDVAQSVMDISHSVSNNASSLNEKIQEQAAALNATSTTMDSVTQAVSANTQTSHQVAELAHRMQEHAMSGTSVMKETISAMQSIRESSSKIADIVTLIDGIAFQTNLLALNAAVEAARAGEHGRGFAVVAGEVRALAQKSAEAAKEIRCLIGDSVARVENGTQLADRSGEMLDSINQSVEQVTEMIERIAQASQAQSTGINQMYQAMSDINKVNQENATLVHDASAAAETLAKEAESLRMDMGFFKTK